LSLSLSPAFGPWGIPPALELPALDDELVDVADEAGAADEDVADEPPPPPQPATAIAATTSASPSQRRAKVKFMVISSLFVGLQCLGNTDSAVHWFLPVNQSAMPSPQPPSITISCPVMYSEAGEARNKARALMSSGRPTRCMGMSFAIAA